MSSTMSQNFDQACVVLFLLVSGGQLRVASQHIHQFGEEISGREQRLHRSDLDRIGG